MIVVIVLLLVLAVVCPGVWARSIRIGEERTKFAWEIRKILAQWVAGSILLFGAFKAYETVRIASDALNLTEQD